MTRQEIFESIPNRHMTTTSYNEGYVDGAEWMQEQTIDKACEWLEKNLYPTIKTNYDNNVGVESTQEFIEKFKQAMK